ncbi:MAG: glycosyltransferase [Phycisphaerales bacterium]
MPDDTAIHRSASSEPRGPAGGLGVVVIGRNEGDRLARALAAVVAPGRTVVYADSGSRDGSPARARAIGAHVVELTSGPHTAARGRQAGVDELLRLHPGATLVQFIDGDCLVHREWLAAARRFLEENPRVAAVTGRRREERSAESFWSRLVDIDWDEPIGPSTIPGGDFLCRTDALREVGGWGTALIAGEDPDLGFRLVAAGWGVHRLPDEMASHDVAMRGFRAYWRRAVRSGYAFAEVGWRHRRGAGRGFLRLAAGCVFYAGVLPIAAVAAGLLWWPLVLIPALLYARYFLVTAWWCRRRGRSPALALTYAALNLLCKLAGLIGVLKYAVAALFGRGTGIIEYKSPAPVLSVPGGAQQGSSPR